MLFNEKLIQRRKERGMTQEELADRLSVSRQTVSKWENGECMPDAEKFIRLSDILGISLDELVGREAEVAPIVLPAPELPQPGKKLRRLLAVAAACLLLCAGCFFLGRYVFPKDAPAESDQAALLPAELKTQSFSMSGRDARFTANADLDGKAFLYRSDFPELAPVELPAVYEDGVYNVPNIPSGNYERMVLVLSADGQERSALVVEGLVINADGACWVDPD